MTTAARLGQRIKALRLANGWTQKRMAEKLGVSLRTVIRLERREGRVMDLTRAKIEKELDKEEVAA